MHTEIVTQEMKSTHKENVHVYSRESNPTRSRAEEVLGRIASDNHDEPAHAVLYSSGYAISVIVFKLHP